MHDLQIHEKVLRPMVKIKVKAFLLIKFVKINNSQCWQAWEEVGGRAVRQYKQDIQWACPLTLQFHQCKCVP